MKHHLRLLAGLEMVAIAALMVAVPHRATAARLWTSGFETNSATAAIEWDFVGAGDWTTSTTTRSGTYAGAVTSIASTAAYYQHQFTATTPGANGPYYFRAYVQVPAYPNVETDFMWLQQDSGSFLHSAAITMDTSGVLRLYNYNSSGVAAQVAAGGPNSNGTSNALSTGTWYRIELKYDRTAAGGSEILEGTVDGVVFATASNLTIGNAAGTLAVGENGAAQAATGRFIFDDVAFNDNVAGGTQTSYPGSGKVIRLTPNAAGDVNAWNGTNTGGTAGVANNFGRVNENTPDDATTLNGSFVLNQEDLFKNNASGIGANDTVNVVEVHGRTRDATADTAVALKLEIEKAAAGTKSQSAAIVPNATTWITDLRAVPHIAPIVLYNDPGGSAWTQATLDTAQIGYLESAAPATGSRQINITNVSALVDYTPAAAAVVITPSSFLLNATMFINGTMSI